ncbi:hypothetical protein [Bdellovibrio sp.]|uniref:hypothetical protein n=1 Tax=Bdellovibrio sp. TaxID=28201 RepID=UPI0039E278B8
MRFIAEEIGCPRQPISNNYPAFDIIEFFQKTEPRIFEIAAPLHRKGMSITDIAEHTGFKRTAIWNCLKSRKEELRSQSPVPFKRWRERPGKSQARPPYGYCYLQGEVVKHSQEYPVLLFIHNLWKRGASIGSIVLALQDRGIKSRMGKSWSYNVIKEILKRLEGKIVVIDEQQMFPTALSMSKLQKNAKVNQQKGKSKGRLK